MLEQVFNVSILIMVACVIAVIFIVYSNTINSRAIRKLVGHNEEYSEEICAYMLSAFANISGRLYKDNQDVILGTLVVLKAYSKHHCLPRVINIDVTMVEGDPSTITATITYHIAIKLGGDHVNVTNTEVFITIHGTRASVALRHKEVYASSMMHCLEFGLQNYPSFIIDDNVVEKIMEYVIPTGAKYAVIKPGYVGYHTDSLNRFMLVEPTSHGQRCFWVEDWLWSH